MLWDGYTRDAIEGKGPHRQPQKRLDRRLEEVAKAVGGGYCRLQMPLGLALGVRGTVAGHRLGVREEGGCPPPPPLFQCIPGYAAVQECLFRGLHYALQQQNKWILTTCTTYLPPVFPPPQMPKGRIPPSCLSYGFAGGILGVTSVVDLWLSYSLV